MENEQINEQSLTGSTRHVIDIEDSVRNGLVTKNLMSKVDTSSCGKPSRPRVTRSTRIVIMLTMTFGFFVVEIIFGYLSHSMALIADSFHMLSDVMALSIAFACLKIAERSSKKNTFGWVRAEVLGALVNGVFLLALCFSIFIESLTRIIDPKMIKEPLNVLIVGVIGLVINLIGIFMFHSHAHLHAHREDSQSEKRTGRRQTYATIDNFESQHLMSSHQEGAMAMVNLNDDIQIETNNKRSQNFEAKNSPNKNSGKKKKEVPKQLNMHGVFLHVLSDALGSVIVIITALVSWLVPGWTIVKLYMDPVLSLAIVVLLVASTFPLVRETALILMQTTPGFIEVGEIENELLKIDGVLAIHEFHVWRLVGERIIATVHIRFSDLQAYLGAADQIRTLFHDNCIHSTTIQPEFSEMVNTLGSFGQMCVLACPPENCKRQDVTCCKQMSSSNLSTESEVQKKNDASSAIHDDAVVS